MADIESCKTMVVDFDPSQIKEASHPYPNEIQECSDLYETAHHDQDALVAVGLDVDCIDRLPFWAILLQQAQSKVNGLPHETKILQQKWNTRFDPIAFLFKDIIKSYRFAYFDMTYVLDQIAQIEEGDDQADFIQDCHDLVLIGRSNPEPLVKINFDTTQLDQLEVSANVLRDIRSEQNGIKYDKSEVMVTRGKTFSLMKKDMDEVRRTGKFVFRNNPDHAKHYASQYDRLRQAAYKRKKKNDAEEVD